MQVAFFCCFRQGVAGSRDLGRDVPELEKLYARNFGLIFRTLFFRTKKLGSDVMQSGFGVNFLFWSGELQENCQRISQRISMANFDSEFFGLVFSRVAGHPKNSRPKFTSRIVGIPLQFHFLEPKIYSRRFSAYGGDQKRQVGE